MYYFASTALSIYKLFITLFPSLMHSQEVSGRESCLAADVSSTTLNKVVGGTSNSWSLQGGGHAQRRQDQHSRDTVA
jgi:hypothetical protein